MTRINVKGSIIDGGSAWLYDWFGIPYTSPESFRAQLEAATDDVIVEINSPGGYVTPAAEIYEAIRTYTGNIEIRVVGQAASAASVIACAAPSSITPMGTFFMHNCIGGAQGNHNDMRQAMQTMESVDENIMEAYRAKTGMSDAEIYALMEENTTLNARRAVELGFIDRITESAADAAQAAGVPASAGIAANATGFVDLMAMDADRLAAIREAYENSRHENGEGGEPMETEDIRESEDDAVQAEAEETEATEAGAEDQDEGAADADEGEAEAEADDQDQAGAEETEPCEAGPEDGEADDAQDAFDRGVLAERERVQAILGIAASVPDAMVQAALFVNPISAEQLALDAIRAEGENRAGYIECARADVAASNSAQVSAEVAESDSADVVQAMAAKVKERF